MNGAKKILANLIFRHAKRQIGRLQRHHDNDVEKNKRGWVFTGAASAWGVNTLDQSKGAGL
jgi:hypothetical protein